MVLLVLAKVLAPSEFGVLAVASLTYNVLLALNQLGIGDALTYLEDRVEEAARTALSMALAAGFILMGLTWVFSPAIAHFFHIPGAVFVLRGFALALPFDAAAQIPVGRMTRSLSFARRTVTDSLSTLIGSAVTIGVVIGGHPLVGLVAGQVTGAVAEVTIAMIVGTWCLPGWNTAMARRLLSYGGYLTAADILIFGLLNVDYVTVGHVLGPAALGYYSLAYRICFMPYLSISAVANGALFPYYCRLPSRQAMARTAENAFSLINAISIPWLVGLVLFAGDIALLGGKWAPAAGAVRFLAVYAFFLSAILSNLQVLKAGGRTDLVFLGRGLHLAILTAVLIATVHLGITVVALDQAVVAAAIAVITGLWTIRYASLRPAAVGRSVSLPLLAALGMAAVVLVGGQIPGLRSTPSWTSLLILGPLALGVFAIIILKIMPEPLRKGWTAIRGRPDDTTADRELPQPAVLGDRRPLVAGAAVVKVAAMMAVAVGAAAAIGKWPLPALAGLAAAGILGLLLFRLSLVVAVLAAGFYFNAYLSHGAGLVTVDKVIGAVAVMAWGLQWAVNRWRVIWTRQLWVLAGFLLWTAVSIGVAVSEKTALQTSLRYLIFATLFFLVVQTVRGDRRQADVLIHVVVAAAAVASVIALVAFFSHHVVQASGPLKDPNDFGFILASTLPLAVYELRWGVGWAKALWGVALALILVCTFATFSRSALTGLAIATLWALLTRRLRLRWVLAAAGCLAVAVGAVLLHTPRLLTTALHERRYVASANVNERTGYYRVELNEWEHYPVTGVGPGNFVYRFYQFAPGAGESLPFPSQVLTISGEEAYLVILAEQGAPGLALFLGYLALSWADLRRRFPADERRDQLQAALASGFIVACIGALFLTEQYYPPLWFLPALAAGMAASLPGTGAGDLAELTPSRMGMLASGAGR